MNNPFNITFGDEPSNFIPRRNELEQITDSFNSDNPDSKAYIITGPRGSGKTVLLRHIKHIYDEKENWLTVDLNPYGNMIEQLCAQLYESGKVKHLFIKTEFNFSFSGFGISIHGDDPISNLSSLADKILSYLTKKKIRILLLIDDVLKNEHTQFFVHAFQEFIGEKYNVFLLMSGLYENINTLELDSGLTFLVRASKIYMEKLSQVAIANSYMRLLKVDKETAIELSKISMGYPYGFQLLGNLLYTNNCVLDDELFEKYDMILEEKVYSLIWKNLSKKDKEILIIIAKGNNKTDSIIQKADISNSALQVYKKRLLKAGLIETPYRGEIYLALPRLKEYILIQKEFEL